MFIQLNVILKKLMSKHDEIAWEKSENNSLSWEKLIANQKTLAQMMSANYTTDIVFNVSWY